MGSGFTHRLRDATARVVGFFSEELWQRRLDGLPPRRALGIRAARLLQATLRGLLIGDALHVRAAALTYFTVLSLVPLLAFSFALLKGFGAYDMLIAQTIRPYVLQLLDGNRGLQAAFEQILSFVERTGVTSLGFVGLLALLYAATRLLRNIEGALNELWGVRSARDPLEQARDYLAIIVVTPICLMGAATLTTLGTVMNALRAAGETLGVAGLVDAVLGLASPLAVLFLGLLFLYKVMPKTRVRLASAAIGAAVGAVLWYTVLIVHVRFQLSVAQFNALYAGFAAVPIFLAWLQISWLVVLVGAQVAATHQNGQSLSQHARLAATEHADKEILTLAAVLQVATSFARGAGPVSAQALADTLDVPTPVLGALLSRIELAGIVVAVQQKTGSAYALGKPADQVHVKDVVDAIRHAPHWQPDAASAPARRAADVWLALDRQLAEGAANRTLAALLEEGTSVMVDESATRIRVGVPRAPEPARAEEGSA